MQQITDKCRKVNLPPVEQATMEFVPSKEILPQFGLLCSVDPPNCEVSDIPKISIKGKNIEFTIITKLDNGDRCSRGGSQVSVQLEGVSDATQVRDVDDGSYMASFVPQQVHRRRSRTGWSGHGLTTFQHTKRKLATNSTI